MALQTGFEFKKRRAFPVVDGVVVAAENEKILIEVNGV
jgi:xeroderma pigmentosum group C-complementing protein